MGQKNVKTMRAAARYYAFLQVQKTRQGKPLNTMTREDFAADKFQLQQHYKRALKGMEDAWAKSSDKGRHKLMQTWVGLGQKSLEKPMVSPVAVERFE